MKEPRFLDQARGQLRVEHYSIQTEKGYIGWMKRYVFFRKNGLVWTILENVGYVEKSKVFTNGDS